MSSQGIIVAKVLSVRIHPNGDRIRLADVDLGDGEPRQIVFGGNRVPCPGDLVAVAPPGSRLSSGIKMRRRHFRGEWSYGMLCSATELGWAVNGPDEIAILNSTNVLGESLDDVDFPDELLDKRSISTDVGVQRVDQAAKSIVNQEFQAEPLARIAASSR